MHLRIRAVLEWAIAMDWRTDNPCDRLLPVLGPQHDVVRHRKALPHREVAAAIERVRARRLTEPGGHPSPADQPRGTSGSASRHTALPRVASCQPSARPPSAVGSICQRSIAKSMILVPRSRMDASFHFSHLARSRWTRRLDSR